MLFFLFNSRIRFILSFFFTFYCHNKSPNYFYFVYTSKPVLPQCTISHVVRRNFVNNIVSFTLFRYMFIIPSLSSYRSALTNHVPQVTEGISDASMVEQLHQVISSPTMTSIVAAL